MSYQTIRRSARNKAVASVKLRTNATYREDVLKIVKTDFCTIPEDIRVKNFDVEKVIIVAGEQDQKWDICHEHEPEIKGCQG